LTNLERVEVQSGTYADSLTLLQVSANARAVEGVTEAFIAMATELNLGILSGMGFTVPAKIGPNDMVVAVRAEDGGSLAAALAVVRDVLNDQPADPGGLGADQPPRTISGAARRNGPGLALISVPGRYAFTEAMDALDCGCDVMIFSDNVPIEHEIMLKEIAGQRGLLVMGPDCGTAIVAGVGLGFAHSVPLGKIGLVAASGTGAQQLVCLLDAAGAGVSAVLGVGGRDLSSAVGGRSARAALAALDEDPATELIVLLSKPPAPEVAGDLRAYADGLATPVEFAMIGLDQPDLTAVTEAALRSTGQPVPGEWPHWSVRTGARPGSGALRGLFAGGTLCYEAMVIAAERLGEISSNIPLRPEWRLDPGSTATGHSMIDFGSGEFTAGRLHPMIDQTLRLDRFAAAAADPGTAVILLDVILGHGTHPDPAAELGPAIEAASRGQNLPVVVSLIGARSDPQRLEDQALALAKAGAHVFASNAQAARFACDLIDSAQSRQPLHAAPRPRS
jgi:FdrA protein